MIDRIVYSFVICIDLYKNIHKKKRELWRDICSVFQEERDEIKGIEGFVKPFFSNYTPFTSFFEHSVASRTFIGILNGCDILWGDRYRLRGDTHRTGSGSRP